jgi:hypothetical protein
MVVYLVSMMMDSHATVQIVRLTSIVSELLRNVPQIVFTLLSSPNMPRTVEPHACMMKDTSGNVGVEAAKTLIQ